jgi:hypothetical protein
MTSGSFLVLYSFVGSCGFVDQIHLKILLDFSNYIILFEFSNWFWKRECILEKECSFGERLFSGFVSGFFLSKNAFLL